MPYTTINKSTDYFNTKLYTGNGSTQSITGVGFQPDLIWIKDRDTAVDWHWWNDVIRGATKTIHSNVNNAESTQASSITAFDSDGFTLGNDGSVNANSENYASWNWLADNTTGSSNTDGSITSTVSANTTAGFSIVSYTGNATAGATVGHGLGVAPKMVIVKTLAQTNNWTVYHESIGATKHLHLNTADAESTATNTFNDTAPTSSVFTLGSGTETNASGNMIAYCFAEIPGYSKFGSYTGNGNADGPFIYTGFKPAFVIYKNIDTGYYWKLIDNKTNTGNGNEGAYTHPNTTDYVNSSSLYDDFYSNGFKIRNTNVTGNGSGLNYIYMAFGQSLVGSNNVPCTAR